MPVRDPILIAFGRNVARLRNGRGISQDKLAEKADLDRTNTCGADRKSIGIVAQFLTAPLDFRNAATF